MEQDVLRNEVGLLVFAVVILCTSCHGDLSSSDDLRWDLEDAQQLSRDSIGADPKVDAHLTRTAARLRKAREIWTYGSEGDAQTEWGLPTDAAGDEDGNIYVVDQLLVKLRILSSDGHLLQDVLREGEGPLEMKSPRGVSIFRRDTIAVYSTSQIRLLNRSDRFSYARSIIAPQSFLDLCSLGGNLFTRLTSSEGTVQKLNADGDAVRVFGDVFQHPDGGTAAQLSAGQIACNERSGRVIVSMKDFPIIMGYDSEGRRSWATQIADFRYPELEPVAGGLSRPGTEGNDMILTLLSLPDFIVLTQVARIGPAQQVRGRRIRKIERFDTYILSAETGEGTYVGSSLPHLILATDGLLVGVVEDEALGSLSLKGFEW